MSKPTTMPGAGTETGVHGVAGPIQVPTDPGIRYRANAELLLECVRRGWRVYPQVRGKVWCVECNAGVIGKGITEAEALNAALRAVGYTEVLR